jgi:hypothetical protein
VLQVIVDQADDAVLDQEYAIADGHDVIFVAALVTLAQLEGFEVGTG